MKLDNDCNWIMNQMAWILNYQPTIREQNINMSERKTKMTREDKAGAETGADMKERSEELFHFVHPELDEAEAWRVHDAVRRVVRMQGIQMICQYLGTLKGEKKVLLPPNPSAAYEELVRMGMPSGEGFNEKTFRKYYNKPDAPNMR